MECFICLLLFYTVDMCYIYLTTFTVFVVIKVVYYMFLDILWNKKNDKEDNSYLTEILWWLFTYSILSLIVIM